MISQKTKYGLKALIQLAQEHGQGPILISTLATQGIPKKFLESILLELKNKGFLHSKKGKGGGYLLAKAPEEIKLGDVIRVFEGSLAPLPCLSRTAHRRCEDCVDEATCGIRKAMQDVAEAAAKILDGTSLADVVNRVAKAPMTYHI